MHRGKKQTTGTKRMIELGYKPLQLWLSPSLRKQLEQAAAHTAQPLARWALEAIAARIARDIPKN